MVWRWSAVAAMAGWLDEAGIAPGDRIAVYARNHPESFITLLAASRIGAIMMPLNWRLSEAELSWQMQDATLASNYRPLNTTGWTRSDVSKCPLHALKRACEDISQSIARPSLSLQAPRP